MDNYRGQFGWKEFHRNRKNILSEYDRLLELNENRPVKVSHGVGVEAYIRKWLSEFLPKKFGVTSGYIIPNLYQDTNKLYHYDIIIYNILDSPVLWTESNEDQSEQGKYRAIPAKHIVAIYEVKSRLNQKNVTDSLLKLDQTKNFYLQLNPLFKCGIIFIELKNNDIGKKGILKEFIKGREIYGFIGGVVLRFEGDDSLIGKIDLYKNSSQRKYDESLHIPLAKPMKDVKIYSNEEGNIVVEENGGGIKLVPTGLNEHSASKIYSRMFNDDNYVASISWSVTFFSEFCINLISSLEGLAFNDEKREIFGQIFDCFELKKSPLQGKIYKKSLPFINIKQSKGILFDKKAKLLDQKTFSRLEIPIIIDNIGEYDVYFSLDSFKNVNLIKKNSKIINITYFNLNIIYKDLIINGLEIPFRIVYYYFDNSEKKFFSIEKTIKILNGSINLMD